MEETPVKQPWEIIFILRSSGVLDSRDNMSQIHRYLIECAKRIWPLIPDKGSRMGVAAAEHYLNG